MSEIILAINPGSTSTKIALYDGEKLSFESDIHHTNSELKAFDKVVDQFFYRKDAIAKEIENHGVNLTDIDIIVGRGGLTYPIASGTYLVNEAMKNDLRCSPIGEHASNLGGLIAQEMAHEISQKKGVTVEAYVTDPVVVDEMQEVARLTGHPLFERKSIFHALNQKAVARRYAASRGERYEDINLIITHLGGGITVAAHAHGRAIDTSNALDGDGPFTPERTGILPLVDVVKMCYSGKYTAEQMQRMIKGEGGFVAHLGTNNTQEVLKRIKNGDQKAALVLDALCYNVAKYIGAMATVLRGRVDAIIITGGMAHSPEVVQQIASRVEFIAPVAVYAGQDEMNALAVSGLGVLRGTVTPKIYAPVHVEK
ncbi:MAG: butyrate kinase [Mucinivorans sp.]